jgi:uncharacterized protein (DUF58 family)
MAEALFSEEFLKRLELLRLALVRDAGSRAEGLRVAGRAGGTGEFREHRNYAFGDEPRYIDWNLYARLEKLFLKEFTPEHEGRALVLLDTSASMEAGRKFGYARRLAAVVGYLASAAGDRLAVVAFSAGRAVSLVPRPGAAGFYELLKFLEGLEASGATGYRAAAERGVQVGAGSGRGAAVWIGDFWTEPADWGDCAALAARGYDTALVRVLSPEECAPSPEGPVLLVDAESGERLEVGGGKGTARAFEEAAAAHAAALEGFASRNRFRLVTAETSRPFEEAALDLLRRGRLAELRGGSS